MLEGRVSSYLVFFFLALVLWFCNMLWFVRRHAKEVCDAIVAKCLTGRPKTVEKAQAAFMLWVELEAVEAFLVGDFMVFG